MWSRDVIQNHWSLVCTWACQEYTTRICHNEPFGMLHLHAMNKQSELGPGQAHQLVYNGFLSEEREGRSKTLLSLDRLLHAFCLSLP